MKKVFLLSVLSFSLLVSSCGGDKKNENDNKSEVKGGIYTGGVIRLNEVENIKSLMPIAINDITSYHVAYQVYEGLVKYNPEDLSIIPAVARSWDFSEDLKSVTFHIRPNVKFHDDPCFADGKGRTVTAADIKYCFDKLCSKNPNNNQFDVTFKDRVEGANDAYNGSDAGIKNVSGVVAMNDSTLMIKLVNPSPGFLNILAMPGCFIYPKEADTKYGNEMRVKTVGTGPFFIETLKEGEVVLMKKNKNYWRYDENGVQMPYLDIVKFNFIREKKSEILKFKSGDLDMIYRIPVEMYSEIMGNLEDAKSNKNEFIVLTKPALNTNFLGFNVQANPVFAKKAVRQAFNYAIDRQKIADFTIQGEGTPADYGIVPFTDAFKTKGYRFDLVKGYTFDPDKAKALMKEAGYPDGKGFPEITLEINSGGGDRNILVAEVVQSMLKENIGVKVNINTIPMAEHIENAQTGKADFFRYGWVADYPDPETFLTLFYGKHVPADKTQKSYINVFRYTSSKFDSLFAASMAEPDQAKRFELLSQADAVMMDDAPFMPIFYDENTKLLQVGVRNLPENAMNYIELSKTYIIPKDKLK
ncbi:MAG: ABC transporter substrate-binding protein [Bacteroidia bacterium]